MEGRVPDPSTLNPIETASDSEIHAPQLEKLRRTLHHAYEHVPDYREAFKAAGPRAGQRGEALHGDLHCG